jgi:hypothetical protein
LRKEIKKNSKLNTKETYQKLATEVHTTARGVYPEQQQSSENIKKKEKKEEQIESRDPI